MRMTDKTAKTSLPPDPQSQYATPEDLVKDPALPRDRKRALLAHWQRDLKQLQTATDENMPARVTATPHPAEGQAAELLQRVSNCLLHLEAD